MKNTSKKLSILLIVSLLTTFTLTGCMPSFDATAYIQACLDANTKGEFEAYAEITNSSVEDVEALYNQAIDSEMAYIQAYNVSDEKKEEFRALFIEMYKCFKYEVGEATRNDDKSYTVPVTTYKLQIFKDFMAEGESYLLDYAETEMEAGNTPTQEELEEVALDYIYNSMKTNLEAKEYAEPVTLNVAVTPTKNGSQVVYSISQTDLQTILESFVDVENAQ